MINLTKSITGRLLIAAACVAATQAAVWQLQRATRVEAAQAAAFDATALPMQLGSWSGKETELDPRVFQQVGALSMVNRSYQNETGRHAAVHVASFPTAEMDMPHLPIVCYAGGGWTILKDDWQTDAHGRRYRLMTVEQDGKRAIVAYWFQLGPHVASNRDELRKILQKLRLQRAGWPPIVKVLVQVPADGSEDDVRASVEELGAPVYEWVKGSL